jgi:hypothetical protein
LIPILLTALVYVNSFPGDFHYDDRPLILENDKVIGPDFDYRFFTEHYGGRPLTLWTFRLNHQFAGSDASAFHLVNALLHLLAVTGVYFLVLDLTARVEPALFSALIFGLHPLQTQAVNYIWSRSMLLMTVFALVALLLIRRWPKLSLLFWQLSIWGRTEGIVIVVLLLLLSPKRWKPLVVLGAVNGAAFLFGLVRHSPGEVAWNYSDISGYWLSQPVIFWKYVSLMIWPSGLNLDHDIEPFHWLLSLAGIAGFAIAAYLLKRFRLGWAPSFALLWLVVPFVPTWLIPNSDFLNESRSYFALGGFAVLVALALYRSEAIWRPLVRTAVAVILVLALSLATVQRNQVWSDDIALWEDSASKSPLKARVRYNLGSALARDGRLDAAQREFETARDLNPLDDLSYAALGYCAEIRGEWELAIDQFSRALELDPDNDYAREGRQRVLRFLEDTSDSGTLGPGIGPVTNTPDGNGN